jgi:hypothetical protein
VSSWLRRNRLGLVLLPVAAALAVAASSSRYVHNYLPYEPSSVSEGVVGTPVDYAQEWQDRSGKYVRKVAVTVDGITPTTKVVDWDGEDVDAKIPAGTTLWRVSLSLDAAPDQVLRSCKLIVVDTRGREYEFGSRRIQPSNLKISPCLNPGQGGPEAALVDGATHKDEEPRPQTWSTVADVLMAEDSVPAMVRVWWEFPEVIEVPVKP